MQTPTAQLALHDTRPPLAVALSACPASEREFWKDELRAVAMEISVRLHGISTIDQLKTGLTDTINLCSIGLLLHSDDPGTWAGLLRSSGFKPILQKVTAVARRIAEPLPSRFWVAINGLPAIQTLQQVAAEARNAGPSAGLAKLRFMEMHHNRDIAEHEIAAWIFRTPEGKQAFRAVPVGDNKDALPTVDEFLLQALPIILGVPSKIIPGFRWDQINVQHNNWVTVSKAQKDASFEAYQAWRAGLPKDEWREWLDNPAGTGESWFDRHIKTRSPRKSNAPTTGEND